MKLEIITVGTELVQGQTINTNAALLAQAFASIGILSFNQQVVDDNPTRLEEAIRIAATRAELIVLAGGIGPTHDDLTKESLAHFLGQELIVDFQQWQYIQDYFKKQNRQLSPLEYKQALTFKEGYCFHTEDGLACGSLYFAADANQYYLCLPGPPSELKAMLEKEVLPYFKEKIDQTIAIKSIYLNFYGIGESQVAHILDPIIKKTKELEIAIYAKPRHIRLVLNQKQEKIADNNQLLDKTAQQIIAKLKDYYIGEGREHTIEAYLIDRLKQLNLTLSGAESLTGGKMLSRLTQVPGASTVIKGGFVVYQAQTKVDLLSVDPMIIEEYSVYSEQCACAMAEQCLKLSGSDLALALSGVAGPGSDQGHPAGEVYLACASKNRPTEWQKLMLPNRGRDYVRDLATNYGYELIKRVVEQKFAKNLSLD
ncbi:competence/damage-inducible protein A [Facklamia sp. P12932]|uniref:competence/damage-inducible protein A n=1 Tax=Facklamia sp. P12932 TaxID=3421947 RepID=UPI003D187017